MNQKAEKQRLPKREIILGIAAVVVTIVFCIVAVYYKDEITRIEYLAGYSLLGMLVIAFIAGSVFSFTAIPVPYWLLVFTLPSILAPQWGLLAPIWVGLTSALGATLGQLPTFMIGYGGRSFSQRVTTKVSNRFIARAIQFAHQHGSITSFIMSALFNPIHLPMTVAIGALRFPPWKFFLFSFLGNSVKSLFLAFFGYYGLSSLFNIFKI